MEYTLISGDLIKQKRGDRSLREIAKRADNVFSAAALFKWERGKQPGRKNLPHLLNALGCSYNDLAVPAELGVDK